MDKFPKVDKYITVSNFVDTLGLVPRVLITKDVVDMIYKSWQREWQKEELEDVKRQEMKQAIIHLSKLKRKPKPILDGMLPLNFQPLVEDVHTAYYEDDTGE